MSALIFFWCYVLLNTPALEKEGMWCSSLKTNLRYLEEILNNDRNYLDKYGHLSHYPELCWTVPKFSANYLKVNVAEQYQEDWGFSKKWSVAHYVQDERVWLTPQNCLLGKPRVSCGVPLRVISYSVRREGGNGNNKEVNEAGQSVYVHPKPIFKSQRCSNEQTPALMEIIF